jgi:two-component system sensor histidine kinase KdpD
VLLVGLLTVVGLLIEPLAAPTNTAMLYLFAVLLIALKWGSGPALVFSFAGAVAFDFFFIPPQRTFTTNETWYLITLITFLSTGLVTSVLASSAREQARAAIDREAHTSALYSLTRSLSAARSLQQVLQAAADHLNSVFGCESAVLLADGTGHLKPCFQSSGWDLPLDEADPIGRAHHQVGGDAGDSGNANALPLETGGGLVGMLLLKSTDPRARGRQQASLLKASTSQIALATERASLEEKAREAEALPKSKRLAARPAHLGIS